MKRRKNKRLPLIRGRQVLHAKRRLVERYGFYVSPEEYQEMIVNIIEGRAHLIKKLSNTRSIFNLKHQNRDVFALYNSHTKRIVTFLTIYQIYQGTPNRDALKARKEENIDQLAALHR